MTGGLAIGLYDGSNGEYILNSGKVSTVDMTVSDSGKGVFTQNNGEVEINGTLFIARGYSGSNPGDGTYNLKDGSLKTGSVWISPGGTGTFNQSGGIHTVSSNLTIDSGTNGSGTYNMMGGILNAVNIINKGAFNLTGGAVSANIENRGTFSGSGTFNGLVTNYGTLSPGNSPGTLNIDGDYTQDSSGILNIELEGYIQGTEYDFLNITGDATLSGKLDVDLLGTFDPDMGSIFNIIHAKGEFTGAFTSWDLPTLNGGRIWQIAYDYDSDDVFLKVAPVPEPSTLLLLGSGLLGVGFLRKRFKKN